jgi:hypothetical protein
LLGGKEREMVETPPLSWQSWYSLALQPGYAMITIVVDTLIGIYPAKTN